MKSIDYLYFALAATAGIHGSYLAILFHRYKALSQRLKGLGKEK